jgi:hypothetical protein
MRHIRGKLVRLVVRSAFFSLDVSEEIPTRVHGYDDDGRRYP